MGLKLSQKVLILVAVPVLFEIGLVSCLCYLRAQTQLQRSQESHSQELVSRFDAVLGMYLQRGSFLILGHYNPSEILYQKVKESSNRIHSELRIIRALVQQDAKEKEEWERLISLADNIDVGYSNAKDSFDKGDKLTAAKGWIKYQHIIDKMYSSWNGLCLEQVKLQEARRERLAHLEKLVDLVLYLAVALSAAIAFGLATFFNLSTSKRLYKIAENTARVAVGRAPTHNIGGSDELTSLDRDIHNLHNSLELMRRKERAVLNNAAEVICTIDRNYKIVDINRAVEELWQFDPTELFGKRIVELMDPDDRKNVLAALENAQSVDSAVTFNCAISKADGTPAQAAWSVTWSKIDLMFYCIVHDISERVRVEKMKRDFVAMVSHDLRTPLTTVQLVHDLLQEELSAVMSDFSKKKLRAASDSVRRLMALVNNLLDLDRLESGRMEIDARPTRLLATVQESIDAIASIARQKKLNIETKVSENLTVEIDPERIVQVLVNLLSNALKYAPANSSIVVSAAAIGEQIKISISDQGPGIKLEDQSLLFDRFKQLSRDDERVHKGSGLGLSICKWIVESHGGEIGVDSELGKGSTFWFTVIKSKSCSG